MTTTWQLVTWSLAAQAVYPMKKISTFPSPDPFIYLIWCFEHGGLLSTPHSSFIHSSSFSCLPNCYFWSSFANSSFHSSPWRTHWPWLSLQSLHACTLRAPLVPWVCLFSNLSWGGAGRGAVGLCATWAFSSCSTQASLVAEHGPWGTRIQQLLQMGLVALQHVGS